MTPITDKNGQSDAIVFLSDPASHSPIPDRVERIDTHAAIIFLAGEFAYKIKRAVRLPYLDFSTLEKRKAVCEREVVINQITAPGLYLGVVAISRCAEGRLHFGEHAGDPIEWAVEMRRFDNDFLFDRLAAQGKLDLPVLTQLADHIAEFHARAIPALESDGAAVMSKVVAETVDVLVSAPALGGQAEVHAYASQARRQTSLRRRLLRQRALGAYVRRCHGDMHLGNIVLLDGRPTLFDAIEFDDEIATIDVLYDLAFVLMDLWHKDLRREANHLVNRYLQQVNDLAQFHGLSLMPLFLAVRAAVRGMVDLHQLPVAGPGKQQELIRMARGHLKRAVQFLSPPGPCLVAIGGLSGTGKSTLAARIAPALGAPPGAILLRSDVTRKSLFQVTPTTRLEEDAYRAEVTKRVYATLAERGRVVVRSGHAAIVDAVFLAQEERDMIRQVALDEQVPFAGLWLKAPGAVLKARVERRKGDASDANAGVVDKQLTRPPGRIEWDVIDADTRPAAIEKAALRQLGRHDLPLTR